MFSRTIILCRVTMQGLYVFVPKPPRIDNSRACSGASYMKMSLLTSEILFGSITPEYTRHPCPCRLGLHVYVLCVSDWVVIKLRFKPRLHVSCSALELLRPCKPSRQSSPTEGDHSFGELPLSAQWCVLMQTLH